MGCVGWKPRSQLHRFATNHLAHWGRLERCVTSHLGGQASHLAPRGQFEWCDTLVPRNQSQLELPWDVHCGQSCLLLLFPLDPEALHLVEDHLDVQVRVVLAKRLIWQWTSLDVARVDIMIVDKTL